MRELQDRKLLRLLKHEGHNTKDYDNDLVTNALMQDYNMSNTVPLNLWSYEELKTRREELVNIAWKLYALYPEYYREIYSYGAMGEQWDITDEMENIAQMYGIDIYGE